MSRKITEPEKKYVAAGQGWRCSECNKLLESTYQVDHTVALMNDGEDSIRNMTAMCVVCHARKTQNEHIKRGEIKRGVIGEEERRKIIEEREDKVVEGGRYRRCSVCHSLRRSHLDWSLHQCPGRPITKVDLSEFAYTPSKSS